MKLRQLTQIDQVSASRWDALLPNAYPFLRHGFLAALERSGSVGEGTGWLPAHLVVENSDGSLQALLPLYQKMHSYGEYVFDWQWAEAWERAGQNYYPKLLAAVPFSPVQGPRLLGRCEASQQLIVQALNETLERGLVSGVNLLFNDDAQSPLLQQAGWEQRLGCQFHWFNRGYQCFEDFLAECSSRKRKNFRKERQSVVAQGITFEWHQGVEITEALWERFFPFYAATYLKRGQQPYLCRAFFSELSAGLSEAVRLVFARQDGRDVAGALFLVGDDTLYGRYWGCLEEFDRLHFETCFYQGMDRCIAEGLKRFDAGAQGEHKLVRGFEPVLTQSWHKLQPGLHEAVAEFLQRERAGVRAYQQESAGYLPFRQVT
ncbi:GNAT family N-acetyltransferase [Halopseudomonas sp.]|uniref:GNAT family N-acetyltransferase n=1 Tax=Halopseudomonas sp. TaxID=2901191 RepID=UPI0030015A4A